MSRDAQLLVGVCKVPSRFGNFVDEVGSEMKALVHKRWMGGIIIVMHKLIVLPAGEGLRANPHLQHAHTFTR